MPVPVVKSTPVEMSAIAVIGELEQCHAAAVGEELVVMRQALAVCSANMSSFWKQLLGACGTVVVIRGRMHTS